MTFRIGVDTGGTFTDFVLYSAQGVRVHKVRSTPDDPSRAILAGLTEVLRAAAAIPADRPWPAGLEVLHGSTVATNAVLERRGARIALFTTHGFEDILRIGRQTRRELYNFFVEGPAPLVEADLTFGIHERLDAEGHVLVPLDRQQVDALVAELPSRGVESVAICFLHSYASDVHERLVAEAVRPVVPTVSTSSGVLSEYREFERWSTTVVNAYVAPVMNRYLGRLDERLPGVTLRVMQSNGGLVSAETARSAAVHTLLSGPAAGAVGALAVAKASGYATAIAFDMGGTSTDVSWLDQGIPFTSESTVGDWPVRVPMVDIHTVGAGGGSIAFLDAGGALRVGPRSAGADPGPACYGRSDLFTVTDANLLLGRLHTDSFLGGTMRLDRDRAQAAAAALAREAGLQPHTLAAGVVRVANANMERAIRVVSVHRGHDPRNAALVAFGGAGGMHACELAMALNVKTVVVPRFAGVLSAFGMLQADVTRDYLSSVLRRLSDDPESEMAVPYERLEKTAREDLVREGIPDEAIEIERLADLRYAGQSYEITVGCAPDLPHRFHAEHRRLYGHDSPQQPIEWVAARVRARGTMAKAPLPSVRPIPGGPVPIATNTTWFNGRSLRTPVFDLDALGSGVEAVGPALLAGASATVVVPPRVRYDIDTFGNVRCHLPTRRGRS